VSVDQGHGPLPRKPDVVAFLSAQRWFSGRDGQVDVTAVRRLATLQDDPRVDVLLVDVQVDDAEPATYQLAVEWRAEPVERLEHVLVGTGPDGACYDAFHDRDVTQVWARDLAAAARVGSLSFHLVEPVAGAGPWAGITLDSPSRVSTAEQSNTSLVFGDEMIIKAYRRVVPGVNPDVEVHVALAQVGCPHIARPLGWVDSPDGVLAFAQEFLSGATEGWETAQASVRDLFVEADLHPGECGGDFSAEAERLGATTAEVHAALRAAFGTGLLAHDDVVARVDLLRGRLATAVVDAPVLAPFAGRLVAAYDDLEKLREPIAVQRVHGDFHLGQTLRTPTGWKILDFEGEPATPAPERRASDTPLRDVAGMLRSLDYAARMVLLDHPDDQQRAYRAAEWAEWNAAAFCRGYAGVAGHDPREDSVLLRALETDKAVYEVVYESRMRPSWTAIPLAAIERLAG
jgi:maltokinase